MDSYLAHTIFQHIDQAKAVGLDAIAVTWHQRICAVPAAIAYARERGILLIPGMEAEVDRRHLVVLNLAEGDLPSHATWNEIRALRLRKPDVLVMAPHPYYPHPSCLGNSMDAHADCIDAVEWCILHVGFLPGRINPNLRAAHWARKHGKTLIATSDAHSLSAIGKNASMVEAEELSLAAILGGIRAGRVTFPRKSLALVPLFIQSSKAMASQPRHIARWVRAKVRKGRGLPADSSSSTGFEALP